MKGFIIFEDFIHFITCKEILDGNYNCVISDYPNGTFSGIINRVTGASCTPKDTYDFETGALIALMKMCGFDKSYKAIEEAFRYNSYDAKKSKELEEENSELKKRINELEIYNNQLEDRVAGEQRGGYKLLKDMEKLEEENEKLKNESMHRLRDKLDLKEKYVALIAENEKLKLDCEKLQHGYNDMIFCGGRQNGKQYTFLVDLFKKLDQKKVDTAYKEAYNTTLPVWQKEVIKQVYEIHEESTKEKTIKPNDRLDSLIEGSKYAIPYADKWIKPLTKREEMWEKIFALHKESDVIIKVKKEDVNAFLHEIENKIPEITWFSTVKIFETKYTIGDIYEELKTYNMIYFRLWKDNRLTYSINPHVYPYRELKKIPYLPPMRWELFKKGRLAVKVTYNNYKEFYEACEKELGKKPSTYFSSDYTVSICKKDGCFEVFTVEHQKKTGRKIVDWEDVR